MKLGAYTFEILPTSMSVVHEDKSCASAKTYSNIAYFSWGASIIGKELLLSWDAMPAAMWAQLNSLFTADASIVFDSTTEGVTGTYVVEMTKLDGKYFLGGYGVVAPSWRQKVEMTLLILS